MPRLKIFVNIDTLATYAAALDSGLPEPTAHLLSQFHTVPIDIEVSETGAVQSIAVSEDWENYHSMP
jgi:hypothetical protein